MLKTHKAFRAIILSSLSLAGAAQAGIWAETGPAFGDPANPDAGRLLTDTNLNVTDGFGSLDTINGWMLNGSDQDLYCIRITDPQNFSAQTSGTTTTHNMALALFDANGNGVVSNYDMSTTNNNARITGALVPSPGVYFLLLHGERLSYPAGPNGFIWIPPPSSATGLVGEMPPIAGAGALSSYDFDFGRGFSSAITQQQYSISLTGATYHVPSPTALSLLGITGLIAARRRRQVH